MKSILTRALTWSLVSLFIIVFGTWIGGPLLLVPALFACTALRLKFFPPHRSAYHRLAAVIHGHGTLAGNFIQGVHEAIHGKTRAEEIMEAQEKEHLREMTADPARRRARRRRAIFLRALFLAVVYFVGEFVVVMGFDLRDTPNWVVVTALTSWLPLSWWWARNRQGSDQDHAAAVSRLHASAQPEGVLDPAELARRTAGGKQP